MKKKLRDYIDMIFADAPDCRRTKELKEEMYANVCDKYDDLIAEGKSEAAAYNISVSSIGDISELIDSIREEEYGHFDMPFDGEQTQTYTDEETRQIERYRVRSGIMTSIAVALYILCWIPLVLIASILEMNGKSSEAGGIIGIVVMMIMIAVATVLMILKSSLKPLCLKGKLDSKQYSGEGSDDGETESPKGADRKNPVLIVITSVLWGLTVVGYLLIGIFMGLWHPGWMVFLIAVALENIIEAIFSLAAVGSHRRGKVAQLVIWVLVAAVLISIFAVWISFDVIDWNFSMGSFSVVGGELYSDGNSYNVGNREYFEAVTDISVSWVSGNVSFGIWDGDHIKIEEAGMGDNEDDFMRSKVEDGKLIIKYVRSGLRFFREYPEKELTVLLPKAVAASLDDVEVDTASANVIFSGLYLANMYDSSYKNGLAVKCMDVDTASGDLNVSGMIADEVNVDTASGNVFLDGELAVIDIDSVSGDVEVWGDPLDLKVDNVSGRVEIHRFALEGYHITDISTVSGEIIINANALSHLDIETVSGNIDVDMKDYGEGFIATLDSVSGKMTCNGSVGDKYTLGKGNGRFSFETVSGNVTIKLR